MANERWLSLALTSCALAFAAACGNDDANGTVRVVAITPPAAPPPSAAAKLCLRGDSPQVLVTLQTGAVDQSIAVDRDYVYFTGRWDASTGTEWVLQRVPKTGGPPQRLAGDSQWYHLADGPFIYGTGGPLSQPGNLPEIRVVPASGAGARSRRSNAMAVDDASIYFTYEDDPGPHFLRVPRAGGAPSPALPNGEAAGSVLLDGDTMYWTDAPFGPLCAIAKDGTNRRQLSKNYLFPVGNFAVDDEWIYIAEKDLGVSRISKAGGPAEPLASNADVTGLFLDDAVLFWSDWHNIYRMPKAGGTSVPIVTVGDDDLTSCEAVGVDEDCLYYETTHGPNVSGALMTVRKNRLPLR